MSINRGYCKNLTNIGIIWKHYMLILISAIPQNQHKIISKNPTHSNNLSSTSKNLHKTNYQSILVKSIILHTSKNPEHLSTNTTKQHMISHQKRVSSFIYTKIITYFSHFSTNFTSILHKNSAKWP